MQSTRYPSQELVDISVLSASCALHAAATLALQRIPGILQLLPLGLELHGAPNALFLEALDVATKPWVQHN